jgi:hypothetical protein
MMPGRNPSGCLWTAPFAAVKMGFALMASRRAINGDWQAQTVDVLAGVQQTAVPSQAAPIPNRCLLPWPQQDVSA